LYLLAFLWADTIWVAKKDACEIYLRLFLELAFLAFLKRRVPPNLKKRLKNEEAGGAGGATGGAGGAAGGATGGGPAAIIAFVAAEIFSFFSTSAALCLATASAARGF
jgi:hypothetical protein